MNIQLWLKVIFFTAIGLLMVIGVNVLVMLMYQLLLTVVSPAVAKTLMFCAGLGLLSNVVYSVVKTQSK